MNLREGILDSIVDDGESIKQIKEYLNYLNIEYNDTQLIKEINLLFEDKMICIEYPKNIEVLDNTKISEYWFILTNRGHNKWLQIK